MCDSLEVENCGVMFFVKFHDNWHVIKESESTGVLQNVILLINTSIHFISSTAKSLGMPKLFAKLNRLEYEYVSTTFLEKLGYISRVQLLINYLISIFMYNLNIFRISFSFPCLCVFISQKKKKKKNCLKTYLKLIIYVMPRRFGVIL